MIVPDVKMLSVLFLPNDESSSSSSGEGDARVVPLLLNMLCKNRTALPGRSRRLASTTLTSLLVSLNTLSRGIVAAHVPTPRDLSSTFTRASGLFVNASTSNGNCKSSSNDIYTEKSLGDGQTSSALMMMSHVPSPDPTMSSEPIGITNTSENTPCPWEEDTDSLSLSLTDSSQNSLEVDL